MRITPCVPTQTAPGHASIYTGSTPSRHGIVANHPYDRASQRTIYVMTDSAARTIGAGSLRRSPHRLLATTLGDEIERRTDGAGKTIGVALKDRASVCPSGAPAMPRIGCPIPAANSLRAIGTE
ncbi:MAG: alkaline phosphatase family protein [Flavobacteriales bacterium]|nr:alkaline phosphatase family protein [Flavobacteriales bacterium]